jgi:hypothetical protein
LAVKVMELDFDCLECDDILKRERGCEKDGIVPFYFEDEKYFRCPLKLISPLSWEYLRAFSFYQKNILPQGKGWLEESQKFLDAMIILENEFKRLEIGELKKKKR